ncbi:MAG: hypothetical protein IPK07_13100 [Deltaproteobacteria bacterium]|nr:hypothetical protein [Deltaproteobacteria bacterium]
MSAEPRTTNDAAPSIAAVPAVSRAERWLYRVWTLTWLFLFAMGCAFVLYAFEIQYRSPLVRAPHVTLGSLAYVLDHILRMTSWGVVLITFLHGLLPVRQVAPAERPRALGEALRAHSSRAAPFVLALALLGAVRDLAELDLFDEHFGEGLYAGALGVRDWLSGTTVGIAAIVAYIVLDTASGSARGGRETANAPSGSPPTPLTKAVSAALMLDVLGRVVTWPPSNFAQDRHFEHIAICSATWEIALVAALLVADDPLRRVRTLGAWFGRNRPVLNLLVVLEALRVVSHQDWYYELAWLPYLLEHSPTKLVFFRGQLTNVTRVAVLGPFLALALAALVVSFHRRAAASGEGARGQSDGGGDG